MSPGKNNIFQLYLFLIGKELTSNPTMSNERQVTDGLEDPTTF